MDFKTIRENLKNSINELELKKCASSNGVSANFHFNSNLKEIEVVTEVNSKNAQYYMYLSIEQARTLKNFLNSMGLDD